MTSRSFIAAVVAVAALALLILIDNVREATAPVFGPPNVDKGKVMSMVESGELSFTEARFYVVEEMSPEGAPSRQANEGAQGGGVKSGAGRGMDATAPAPAATPGGGPGDGEGEAPETGSTRAQTKRKPESGRREPLDGQARPEKERR